MVTPVFWDKLWQRHQSFALELAKLGYKVYYMQPLKSGGLNIDITEEKVNGFSLNIISCSVPFKATFYPALNHIATKLAYYLLRKKLNLIPIQTILWLSEPSLSYFTNYKWKKIVYDKCDLHGFFPGQKQKIWKKYENEIYCQCDLCFVSHEYLLNSIPGKIKSLIVKNAVSDDFKPSKPKLKRDDSILKLVSCGAHYEWVDFKWLSAFLEYENTELHIIGTGRGEEFEQLLKNKNVIYHGQIEHNELPDLLQNYDIGLVPFKNIELIKGVDPIKIYEYAVLGLKVWAPYIKSLSFNPIIDCFIKFDGKNKKIISNDNKYIFTVPTWKNRICDIIKVI